MRHLQAGRKLNRTASHRKAMLSNLAMSIFLHESVKTTVPKAKEVRSLLERNITYAKRGDLHSRRLAAKTIRDKDILRKLFDEIGPGFKEREGGYVRIMRTDSRKGDNAEMCIIELVGRGDSDEKRNRKKKKKSAPKKVKKISTTEKKAKKSELAQKAPEENEATPKAENEQDTVKSDSDEKKEDKA